jgi:hypothetical protein
MCRIRVFSEIREGRRTTNGGEHGRSDKSMAIATEMESIRCPHAILVEPRETPEVHDSYSQK